MAMINLYHLSYNIKTCFSLRPRLPSKSSSKSDVWPPPGAEEKLPPANAIELAEHEPPKKNGSTEYILLNEMLNIWLYDYIRIFVQEWDVEYDFLSIFFWVNNG